MTHDQGPSTRAVHAGEAIPKPFHAITAPVCHSSVFTFADTSDLTGFMEARESGAKTDRTEYGRYGNPTVTAAERKLAELEGAESALLFTSGMSAVSSTMFALLHSGAHVVMTDDCYRRTREYVRTYLARYGVQTTVVPLGDYRALELAIQPDTKVILSESPTNPYLRLVDLERVVEAAHRHGLTTIIDSTLATPLNQRPLDYGVDVVIHSATKYLGGHNDILAGAVLGSNDIIAHIREVRNVAGGMCDPASAYLLLRGTKTLALRMARHNENGMRLAHFLEQDSRVRRVFYPGLESHPDHAVFAEQMEGAGGVVSFELNEDMETTARFVDALQIPHIGPSLGGTESLVGQVSLMSYFGVPPEELAQAGISTTLVRFAAGIEDSDDLIADVSHALDSAFTPR